jgi:hypothetical protein
MSFLPDDQQLNVASESAPPPPAPAASAPVSKKKSDDAAPSAFSSLRVSLMPSDLEGAARPNLGWRLLVFTVVVVAETAVIGGLYYLTSQTVTAATAKRDAVLADIDSADKSVASRQATIADAADYAYQVADAGATLDAHLYWTDFFAFLEKRTLPDVTYANFSGDAGSGTVTLEADATSYRDAAEQIVALREDPSVISVLSDAAAAKVDEKGNVLGVSFTMVVKCKPEVWMMPQTGAESATTGTATTSAPAAP